MQWLVENWPTIAALIGSLITYLVGHKRGAKAALSRTTRPPQDSGTAVLALLVIITLLLGVAMGCTRSWTDNVQRTVTVAYATAKAAMDTGMPRYEERCEALARNCGATGDTHCERLRGCHQTGDTIVTAYSGANAAMAMALLTVAAIEMLTQAIDKAGGKERLALETEREQLTAVAMRQLRQAQRQGKRVADELQKAGAL